MSPKPIDLRRVRAGLARLDVLLDTYPELREPEAQARLTAWLAQEQRTMTLRKGRLKGDEKARARVQRLRQRRKEQGWQPFELWLPPYAAALLTELKQPGEALHTTIERALLALQTREAVTSNVTGMPSPHRSAQQPMAGDDALLALLQSSPHLKYTDIAAQLGMSESSVKHKAAQWAKEGLVPPRPRGGARPRPQSGSA